MGRNINKHRQIIGHNVSVIFICVCNILTSKGSYSVYLALFIYTGVLFTAYKCKYG